MHVFVLHGPKRMHRHHVAFGRLRAWLSWAERLVLRACSLPVYAALHVLCRAERVHRHHVAFGRLHVKGHGVCCVVGSACPLPVYAAVHVLYRTERVHRHRVAFGRLRPWLSWAERLILRACSLPTCAAVHLLRFTEHMHRNCIAFGGLGAWWQRLNRPLTHARPLPVVVDLLAFQLAERVHRDHVAFGGLKVGSGGAHGRFRLLDTLPVVVKRQLDLTAEIVRDLGLSRRLCGQRAVRCEGCFTSLHAPPVAPGRHVLFFTEHVRRDSVSFRRLSNQGGRGKDLVGRRGALPVFGRSEPLQLHERVHRRLVALGRFQV